MAITKVKGSVWDSADNGLGVNVLDFGAVGDGVTDDTAAIQAAIDYIKSSGKNKLLIPAGNYRITSPLVIKSQFLHIEGESENRSRNGTTSTANGTVLTYTGANAPTNGLIEGSGVAGESRGFALANVLLHCNHNINGIYITNGEKLVLSDCVIENAIDGIFLDGCFSSVIERVELLNPTNSGINLNDDCHSASIIDCEFTNSTEGSNATTESPAYGLHVGGVGASSIVNVTGCNFDYYDIRTATVRVEASCKSFNFIGNYVETRAGNTSNDVIVIDCWSANISANRISGSPDVPTSNTRSCVRVAANASGVTIANNYFEYFDTAAITTNSGSENIIIYGNYVASGTELDAADGTVISYIANGTGTFNSLATSSLDLLGYPVTETLTATGWSDVSTVAVSITKVDKTVTLQFAKINGTSDSATTQLGSLSAEHIPSSRVVVPARVMDNGTWTFGLIDIATNGVIYFKKDALYGAFTSSGNKQIDGFSISYIAA